MNFSFKNNKDEETMSTFSENGIDTENMSIKNVSKKQEPEKEKPISVDKYGFYISDDFHTSLLVSAYETKQRRDKEAERTTKWVKMIKNWDGVILNRQEKLKRRVRKGIPDQVRGLAWIRISESWRYSKMYPKLEDIDVMELDELTVDEIERDINRTFPRHLQFESLDKEEEKNGTTAYSQGQLALRRLLQLYAVTDKEVGYCQGMAFIAGLLLTYMSEEQAFYCFLSALKSPKYNLRAMFLTDMMQAQKGLFVFGALGKKHLGKLWMHLESEGIHHTMYATEWLLTMYCRGFSFDLVTRVWDVFFNEGYKIVYRVALALVKYLEKELLASNFEEILGIFRTIAKQVDAERLMDLAWTIPLKSVEIIEYEKQFTESLKAKEKLKEVQSNRST